MANYSELIQTINGSIKANGNQEITGPVLNSVLQAMLSGLESYTSFSFYNLGVLGNEGYLPQYFTKEEAITFVYNNLLPEKQKQANLSQGICILYQPSYAVNHLCFNIGGSFNITDKQHWQDISLNDLASYANYMNTVVEYEIPVELEPGFFANNDTAYDGFTFIQTCARTAYYYRTYGLISLNIQIDGQDILDAGYKVYLRFCDKEKNMLGKYTYEPDIAIPDNCYFFRFSFEKPGVSPMPTDPNALKLTVKAKGYPYYPGGYERGPYVPGLIRLSTRVNEAVEPSAVLDTDVSDPVKYTQRQYTMRSILLQLPASYSENGAPTRLIIFAHGSGTPDVYDWGNYAPYVDYLVHEGYAVADCSAFPTEEDSGQTGNAVGTRQFMCTPQNIACYTTMYYWLMKKYNFLRDVFIFGKSHGGLQVYSLPYLTNIPIIASASLAGAYSIIILKLGYTDSERIAYMRAFGFSGMETDESGNIIGDARIMLTTGTENDAWTEERITFLKKNLDKCKAYMPEFQYALNYGLDEIIPAVSTSPVDSALQTFADLNPKKIAKKPVAIFVAKDDVTLYRENGIYAIAANNMAANIMWRFMPSGSGDPHHTVDTAGPFIESITTKDGTVVQNVPVAWAEMLTFFKSYE